MMCKNCNNFWNTRKGTICLKKTYRKAIRDGYEYVKPTDCCDEYEEKNEKFVRGERKETNG